MASKRLWETVIPREKFPAELESVTKRDKNALIGTEFVEFVSGASGIIRVPRPQYVSTDEILCMLVKTFPSMVFDIKSKNFESLRTEYRAELGRIIKDWDDKAIRAIADCYALSPGHEETLFKEFKKYQKGETE